MNIKKQTILTLFFSLIAISLLGFYIYKDLFIKNIGEIKSVLQIATTTPEELEETASKEEGNMVIKKLSNAPSLEGPFFYSPIFTNEAKEIMEQKIQDIIVNLDKNPESFSSWLDLGNKMKMIGDMKNAEKYWLYASELNPQNYVPYNNLGDIYHYNLKDYPRAEEMFLKSKQINPSYTSTYINLHNLYKYSYQQNTNKAEEILLEALTVLPNNIDITTTLASYYKEKGNNTKAIEYFEKASAEAQKIGNTNLYTELQTEIKTLE